MKSNKSPRLTPTSKPATMGKYPLPVYLDFVPGGIEYREGGTEWKDLNSAPPKDLIAKAHAADSILHLYSLLYARKHNKDSPYYLPSLSVLAEAAFGTLTGVAAGTTRVWANSMVMSYLHSSPSSMEKDVSEGLIDEQVIFNEWKKWTVSGPTRSREGIDPKNDGGSDDDVVSVLKSLYTNHIQASGNHAYMPKRPCGYLFRKGDIAWNCRTCQYDPTCVLCDACFKASNHTGHEVYFHRTSAGGCCDCGDPEAFRLEGCCPQHTPDSKQDSAVLCQETTETSPELLDPDFEAVVTSKRSRAESDQLIKASLPPKFAAALGVVMGAAIQAIVRAVEGSAIGADPIVWSRKWADQLFRIRYGHSYDEEYSMGGNPASSLNVKSHDVIGWSMKNIPFVEGFHLHLRIHNDDVHTYEEVTAALFDRNATASYNNQEEEYSDGPLIFREQDAHNMTASVDTDGQVIVRKFSRFQSALKGFQRLKRTGLHCAIVSTPQLDSEERARVLMTWLHDVAAAHPAAASLVVQGLVDVTEGKDLLGDVRVWGTAHMIPPWSCRDESLAFMDAMVPNWRKRLDIFPPHLQSSFLTREECFRLHSLHVFRHQQFNPADSFSSSHEKIVCDKLFYGDIPYSLASERYHKSPHSLWGTVSYNPSDMENDASRKHPFLRRHRGDSSDDMYDLVEEIHVVDTDTRRECDSASILRVSLSHEIDGLHMISGVGLGSVGSDDIIVSNTTGPPSIQKSQYLLSVASFRAAVSPLLLLVLFDPYPSKQSRASCHSLLLSLLTDSRFKTRLAVAFGGVSYRPLTTLYSAGVGTDGDSILHFNVQVFTAGSLVRALGNIHASRALLCCDNPVTAKNRTNSLTVTLPISYSIALAIHYGLLGAEKDAKIREMTSLSQDTAITLLPPYRDGEHPITTLLPAISSDDYLEERSIQHKRLQKLMRDIKHIIETPGTALRLLSSASHSSLNDILESTAPFSRRNEFLRQNVILRFPQLWCRLLRLIQGIDIQKRKISGGHVEYEKTRWREALSLSMYLLDACDALAECPFIKYPPIVQPTVDDMRHGLGQLLSDVLCEIKRWLYKEDVIEASLPTLNSPNDATQMAQMEVLQRSTLHVTKSMQGTSDENPTTAIALSCATQVKLTEAHLELIEDALQAEMSHRSSYGAIMGDWLRVPHSLLEGDALSFHIPLHRMLSKCILSLCCKVVSNDEKVADPQFWWRLPVLDVSPSEERNEHPLCEILRPSLRPDNCKVFWSSGPECLSRKEAEMRLTKCRTISAAVASAKVIHSLCDHPLRCIVAAEQISRHLWVRNGHSAAYTSLHYMLSNSRHSFRDLDFALVQLSAAGYSLGLGARRVFGLLVSRFSLDGYLCDPERKPGYKILKSGLQFSGHSIWVNPPRLQDQDHASILAESFFTSLCVLVTELPPSPPTSSDDFSSIRSTIRRELIHVLAAEPRTYSEALSAVSAGMRDDDDTLHGGNIRSMFTDILREVARQKIGNRSTGTPTYELKSDCSEEYDPTFMHLRRSEHQHALDNIARLRKLLHDSADSGAFPVVLPPRTPHPRFSASRLILHLPSLDAAIRRFLLFALTGGQWLPPEETTPDDFPEPSLSFGSNNSADDMSSSNDRLTRRNRFVSSRQASSSIGSANSNAPFSSEVVANSSISFIEVLVVITLQIHTLKECADLHRSQPYLDDENRAIASGLSVETYLERLVYVPESLKDIWALRCHPFGPLSSQGSGSNRGSILGLLVALYEHWAVSSLTKGGVNHQSRGADGLNGARYITIEGLKWLLRVVSSLATCSDSIDDAYEVARTGIRKNAVVSMETERSSCRAVICSMLHSLDLWPQGKDETPDTNDLKAKNREARLAAQKRILDNMKKKQQSFIAQMTDAEESVMDDSKRSQGDTDLCIICRCDDTDGEHYAPLGYLGYVQRSRQSQLRSSIDNNNNNTELYRHYLVVGERGCQLREGKEMDSKPITCLDRGGIVRISNRLALAKYGLLSRRVFVSYAGHSGKVIEGWASLWSTRGTLILEPLSRLCYTNSRWGSTRPILRQCGHAAHSRCVEIHILSLHQKNATDHPYDGRFAANLNDGEFLCPLCKQLSNVLIPKDSIQLKSGFPWPISDIFTNHYHKSPSICRIRDILSTTPNVKLSDDLVKALSQFGASILHTMQTSSWDSKNSRKKMNQNKWAPSLRHWDYIEDNVDDNDTSSIGEFKIGDILSKLRQQLLAWAAVGHTSSAFEVSGRQLPDSSHPIDPWREYDEFCTDSHPMLIELRRVISATSQLQVVLYHELETRFKARNFAQIFGCLLADILEGVGIHQNNYSTQVTQISKDDWHVLGPLLVSSPCHVARDGTLHYRNEARAVAVSMWLMSSTADGIPVPFYLRKALQGDGYANNKFGEKIMPDKLHERSDSLFLPFVASAYLYVPLLCWDLDIFAGAIFSSMVTNVCEISSLFEAARLLLVARLTQIVISSGNVREFIQGNVNVSDHTVNNYSSEIVMNTDVPISSELMSSIDFWNMCMYIVRRGYVPVQLNREQITFLFSLMGKAILPYARSIVLLLRATVSAVHVRVNGNSVNTRRPVTVLESDELMFTDDGFTLLKELGVPSLKDLISSDDSAWFTIIKRWLLATLAFESFHLSYQYDPQEKVKGDDKVQGDDEMSPKEEMDAVDADDELCAQDDGSDEMDESEGGVENDEDMLVDEDAEENGFDRNLGWSDDVDDEEMEEAAFDRFDIDEVDEAHQSGSDDQDDANDNNSSDGSYENVSHGFAPPLNSEAIALSSKFAGVSRSPIIPYQSSFLGSGIVSPGHRGRHFDYHIAAPLMRDLSHLGTIHHAVSGRSNLIRLPHSFIELYGLVNEIKSNAWLGSSHDEAEEQGVTTEPAICLITGEVLQAGRPDRQNPYSDRSLKQRPGNCTLFARKMGSGTGIFFMVQKCTVLLIHNNKSVYSPSLYVDENGEEDYGLLRGRPLFLSEDRYRALDSLWQNHGVPREVARIRSTADRILRDNWY